MSEAFEVVIESNDPSVGSRMIVRADSVQALHDRLTAVVDAASFTLVGAATAAMRAEVEAHRTFGDRLEARPDDAPVEAPKTEPEPPAQQAPASDPWSEGLDAPNLPAPSTPATPPTPAPSAPPAGNFPPKPKWAQ